jgi:hypothetical protein
MRFLKTALGLATILVVAARPAPAQSTEVGPHERVFNALRQQPVGDQVLDDLALPEPFLNRVADRIVRMSFLKQYRGVASGGPTTGAASPTSASAPTTQPGIARRMAPFLFPWVILIPLIAAARRKRRNRNRQG